MFAMRTLVVLMRFCSWVAAVGIRHIAIIT